MTIWLATCASVLCLTVFVLGVVFVIDMIKDWRR